MPHTPSGYVDGLRVTFRPLNPNTGACTINVNSLGVKSIRRTDGTECVSGDITAGGIFEAFYSTATGFFHLTLNPSAAVLAGSAVISVNGSVGVVTGLATTASNTFTGLQNFSTAANIASATAVDLTAATGNTVVITGTTETTSLTMNSGQQMILLPSGAWPLTFHATTMNINGGVSYTAAAGDRIYAVKDLAGVIRVSVIKQDGTALTVDRGGADTTSSAIDLVLVATSGRLQVITMTAADKKVTLPSATILQKGAPIFVFKNSGAYKFDIHDGGGGYLASVTAGQTAAFHCSDISSSAGVWSASGNDLEFVKPGTVSVLNAVATTNISVDMISTTAAIVAFKNGTTSRIGGVVVNIGAAEGSVTALTVENSEAADIKVLSSTQMLLAYRGATNKPRCVVVDYSGNTLTPGTAIDITAVVSGSGISVSRTSNTSAVVSFDQTSPLEVQTAAITISGSTPSAGTPVITNAATIVAPIKVQAISATKGLSLANTTSGIVSRLFSISGSVITATGSLLTLNVISASAEKFGVCLLDSNRALVTHAGSTSQDYFKVFLLDISDTSPVLLDSLVCTRANGNVNVSLSRIDDSTALLAAGSSFIAGANMSKVRITGNKIYIEPMTKMYTVVTVSNSNGFDISALSTADAVLAYRGLDTFLNIQEVKLGL